MSNRKMADPFPEDILKDGKSSGWELNVIDHNLSIIAVRLERPFRVGPRVDAELLKDAG
jgi:hypothetical protein